MREGVYIVWHSWHFLLFILIYLIDTIDIYNGTQMALMALLALKRVYGTILKNGTHGTIVFLCNIKNIYIVRLHAYFKSANSAIQCH